MNERKIKMLETAIALFAKKGYHATSIQEITEAWGISKGAFYNNFSSKEELMFSIMKYYTELAFEEVKRVVNTGDEKETLIEQIRIQFSIIESHKEFIRIQMTEPPQQLTEELQRYMFEVRAKMFKWYMKRLKEVYGEKIDGYELDCVVLLTSMLHGYMGLIILDQKQLSFEKTARFLVHRLDSIIHDLGGEEPLLTHEVMENFLQTEDEIERQHVRSTIGALRAALPVMSENLASSLDALEAELTSSTPREYIAEGLLLYLEKQSVEEWKMPLRVLEESMKRFFQAIHAK